MVLLSTLVCALATVLMAVGVRGSTSSLTSPSAGITYDIASCEDLTELPTTDMVDDVVLDLTTNNFLCSSVRPYTSDRVTWWGN